MGFKKRWPVGQERYKMNINVNGESVEVKFSEPNQSQIFELDKFYRKIFSECVRGDIMTEAEAKKRYEKSGAWTEVEEAEMQVLIQKLAFGSVKLENMEEVSEEATDLISSIQSDRADLFDLIASKTELLSNTAEGMSNEQKVFKYIALCLCSDDGKVLFGSDKALEDYAIDNRDDFSSIVHEAYGLVYGIDNDKDITEDWAEVKFFKKVSEKSETEDK
jgi:hypothetical protein